MRVQIIGKSKLWLGISIVLVVLSLISIMTKGLNLGIDFTGGSLFEIKFEKPETILGYDTITQINAGIYFSNIGAIKEIILEYKKEIPNAYVIATGGQGIEISKKVNSIDEYIPNLGPNGLFEFYKIINNNY